MLTDEDEMSSAPESGQPLGGRDNPWDDDDGGHDGKDEQADDRAFPADHRAPPGDDL
jgi:hypothetical protein